MQQKNGNNQVKNKGNGFVANNGNNKNKAPAGNNKPAAGKPQGNKAANGAKRKLQESDDDDEDEDDDDEDEDDEDDDDEDDDDEDDDDEDEDDGWLLIYSLFSLVYPPNYHFLDIFFLFCPSLNR